MRAAVAVPRQHREALASLAVLDDSVIQRLLAEFNASEATDAALRSAFVSIAAGVDEAAFDALMTASVFRSSRGLSAADLASDLLEDSDHPGGEHALELLLSNDKVVRVAKVFDLLWANERIVSGTRVLTDVRPLFDDSDDALPLGSTIVHTLQVSFFAEGGAQELHLTLDRDDLESLRDHATRALIKARRLRSSLAGTGLEVIGKEDA